MSVGTTSPRRLDWDSTFFGFPVAQAEPATAAAVDDVDAWAECERIRCLYLLASSDRFEATRAAEARGFYLTGIRVSCTCDASADRPQVQVGDQTRVRPVASADLQVLERIAGSSHVESRFYADPNFSRTACDRLYQTWIRRSCEGWADCVLVAEADGKLCGYISLHLPTDGAGSIGLVAVDRLARGQGIGRALIGSALHWFRDHDLLA